ncbi:Innexin unc-9, partial [Lamellibrachia satsuma]
HTVQCVLPINLFNEKIYIFLWFWMVFVAAATCLSFLRWIWVLAFRYSRVRYIRKHLLIMNKLNRDDDRDAKLSYKFAELYLRQDGVFVLKLVAKNSTDLVVADIVSALWDNYRNKPM